MRNKDSVLKHLLRDQSKMYYALNEHNIQSSINPSDFKDVKFGKNSAFFNTMMADGHVFNPYIHRRFLPAKFKKMCETSAQLSLDRYDDLWFSGSYMFKIITKELHVASILMVADPAAFEERTLFFDFRNCMTMIRELLHNIKKRPTPTQDQIWVDEMLIKLQRAATYEDLERVSKQIKDSINDRWIVHSAAETQSVMSIFSEIYVRVGAYYSIKNELMFHHKTVDGFPGEFGCNKLRGMIEDGISTKELVDLARSMWH